MGALRNKLFSKILQLIDKMLLTALFTKEERYYFVNLSNNRTNICVIITLSNECLLVNCESKFIQACMPSKMSTAPSNKCSKYVLVYVSAISYNSDILIADFNNPNKVAYDGENSTRSIIGVLQCLLRAPNKKFTRILTCCRRLRFDATTHCICV